MYKKFVRTVIVLGVLAYVGYKAYNHFVKKNNEEPAEDFEDFDVDGEISLNEEESFVDKLKSAAQKVLG